MSNMIEDLNKRTDDAMRDALFTCITNTLRELTEIISLANIMKVMGYQPAPYLKDALALFSIQLSDAHRLLEKNGAVYITAERAAEAKAKLADKLS